MFRYTVIRLLFLLWVFILLPLGLYRFTFRFYQFCFTMNKLCYIKGCCTRNILLCIFLFLYCIFPIILFSYITRKCIDGCSCFENSNKKNTNKKFGKVCLVLLNLVRLVFPITYVVCLRPIISTFTFLFRSFTFFVFVALPIRVHVFRYTFLVAITLKYFAKYIHEIVDMNSEVLKYVFICEEKRKHEDVISIDEKLFD